MCYLFLLLLLLEMFWWFLLFGKSLWVWSTILLVLMKDLFSLRLNPLEAIFIIWSEENREKYRYMFYKQFYDDHKL